MKFGKTIQSQQVPGWGEYYLNYKALKKIINSYAAGRPASDASLLSLGLRPAKRPLDASPSGPGFAPPLSVSASPLSPYSLSNVSASGGSGLDLEPLPPNIEPPSQSRSSIVSHRGGQVKAQERSDSFKAHRDVFFFTLQRELEKINTFYLIKERDLRLRLLTLLTNRRRLLHHYARANGDASSYDTDGDLDLDHSSPVGGIRKSTEWVALSEGWRLFERDLGKLQGFIEINATGFRKILKKWDKRSKSSTKELYIERQVEVQPCFNRELLAKLSDVAAANLLDLQNGAENVSETIFADLDLRDQLGINGLPLDWRGFETPGEDSTDALAAESLADMEINLGKACAAGKEAIADWLKVLSERQKRDNSQRVKRVAWRAALQVPDEYLDMVRRSLELDFSYVDNINARSVLHQACIAGKLKLVRLCLDEDRRLLERPDTYERRPLHYAALHGHPAVVSYLLSLNANCSATDMDGYTPLMHAIVQGHLEVVQLFVNTKSALDPTPVSNDLIPLSLACQFGHVDVARLLLRCGAKVLPNSEGLYPQHFAAKAGHEAICRLLIEEGGADGGGKSRADKYNLWTPLHHAAVGGQAGHLACIKLLVAAGCDLNAPDEYGKSPGWYAAWYGHVECLNFFVSAGAKLNERSDGVAGMGKGLKNLGLAADPQMENLSPGSDMELDKAETEAKEDGEFELIPSLSLPPPIIPLRVYGHEFLAQRSLVQISLGHPFSRSTGPKPPPIKLYSRSSAPDQTQNPLQLWSSLKLVMTSKSDMSAVPHSVILPLADEREVFTFQVADLSRFILELSLYPTFGSKVIGRAVVLPASFADVPHQKALVAPLLDHQLKTIGEVNFQVSSIKPFEGAQLEIGGRVETYWKSKVTPSTSTQDHAHQYQAHRPLSVSTSSPALRPPAVAPSSNPPRESALVTASSLSGEYINVVIQVTKDGHPVVYPEWLLPVPDLSIGVPDVSLAQFQHIAHSRQGTPSPPSDPSATPAHWHGFVSRSLLSLAELLHLLPADKGVNFQLKFTRPFDAQHMGIGQSMEVNAFVDAVLKVVYDAGKEAGGHEARKIVFSSFEPTVCTALNWKQPNYAVFFASYCGIDRTSATKSAPVPGSSTSSTTQAPSSPGLRPTPLDADNDLRCLSVREAVNFAKSTNLLGVILEATTLAAVPSLLASVKDAGLVLAAFGREGDVGALRAARVEGRAGGEGRVVDAHVEDGVMVLTI